MINMPTIKLDKPLIIKAGEQIPSELFKDGTFKLPFEATGMKTSKNQGLIDSLGFGKAKSVKSKEPIIAKVEEPIAEERDAILEVLKNKPKKYTKSKKNR